MYFEFKHFIFVGLVPIENDSNPEPDPEWGLEVIFTKRAEINYGPWVDLQRYKEQYHNPYSLSNLLCK